jgi:hypothetical protein
LKCSNFKGKGTNCPLTGTDSTEGFDTADLKNAKALLDELNA